MALQIQPGMLNKQIVIQSKTSTEDADGVKTPTWSTVCTIWAAVSDLYGREYYAAAAVQMEQTTKFTVRHRTDITTAMRISYGGNYYHIDQIDKLDHKGQWMILRARLVESEAGQ
jgi:SPP1 family predicted phage head-tail adaptor